jgi:SAM-dependent methyltransferase
MEHHFAREYRSLEQWHWWFLGRKMILETILRREISSSPTRDILSVGCGPAEGLKWLLQFAGKDGVVTGLDIDPAHGSGIPDRIQFVAGTLEEVPFATASFDVVLALDVLEHIEGDLAALHEAIRLLNADGLLVITVPALPFLWGRQDIVSGHWRRYTRKSITSLLQRAGLTRYKISYFNTLLFPVVSVIRVVRRLLGTADRARSDFAGSRPGVLNNALRWLFSLERYLVFRIPMPIGISILATCRLRAPNRSRR